jgi:hypothetical protein
MSKNKENIENLQIDDKELSSKSKTNVQNPHKTKISSIMNASLININNTSVVAEVQEDQKLKKLQLFVLLEEVLIFFEDTDEKLNIYVRPFIDEFLTKMSTFYSIIIFSFEEKEVILTLFLLIYLFFKF